MEFSEANPLHLRVTDLDDSSVQPASIDVHLGNGFRYWVEWVSMKTEFASGQLIFDPETDKADTYMSKAINNFYVLRPGEMVLGCTNERIAVGAGLCARVEGRSTLGRLGLIVETAGFIDPGFGVGPYGPQQVTLEIVNHSPVAILLKCGMDIGQLIVERISSPALRPYGHDDLGSRYTAQAGPTAARTGPREPWG